MSVLTTARNNLDTRLRAIAQQESLLDAERAYAVTEEAALDALLQQEASYVENIAKGEASIILLLGFPLAQEPAPIGQLAPPQNLLGTATDLDGTVKLRWNPVRAVGAAGMSGWSDPAAKLAA